MHGGHAARLLYPQHAASALLAEQSDSYSHQASGGVQWQLANDIGIQADYVYQGARHVLSPYGPNAYLTFDPATGLNYPANNAATRVWPWWVTVFPG